MITIEQMVQREVLCCMSSLVSTLTQGFNSVDFQDDIRSDVGKNLMQLAGQASELAAPVLDYEEAARQEGWKHVGSESDRCMLFSKGTSMTGTDVVRATTWADLCEQEEIDPYEWEVYEHWAVTQWFAEQLQAQGERVDTDFAGLNIWARTTTGQAIDMDGAVQKIYREMVK